MGLPLHQLTSFVNENYWSFGRILTEDGPRMRVHEIVGRGYDDLS